MDIAESDSDKNQFRRIASIAALSIGTSAIVLDGGISAVALPTIAQELGIGDSASVFIITGYQLVLASTILPFAALAGRIGFQRIYQYGQLVFLVASLLLLFIDSLGGLIAVRLLQALGGAAALSVTSAMVRSLYPPEQLGRGLAINSVLISITAALAPTVGGIILAYFPWQASFAVAAPLICCSLLLGRAMPRGETTSQSFDPKASLLCAIMIGSVIGGMELAIHGKALAAGIALIAAGSVAGLTLYRHEKGNSHPVLPLDLLTNPFFARAFTASVSSFTATIMITIYLPFWLAKTQGSNVTEIGMLLAVWPLTMMLVSPLSGILSDKVRPGILGSLGMLAFIGSALMLSATPESAGFVDLGWRMALGGLGFALFLAPNSRLIVSVAPASRAASAGSMVSTGRLFGQALGATLVAAILSRIAPGSTVPFLAASLLGVVSLVLSALQLRQVIADNRAETAPA
jgi:MFS transporter, DHA2 family, multidrug resistance protein